MPRMIPLVSAIAIVIGSGLVDGRWADRVKVSHELEGATARLERLPMTIGDWRGHDAEIDREGLERAGISGLITRRYEDRRTGDAVTILLVCGRPGPIAVHGPEICYAGAGYEAVTPIVKTAVPGSAPDGFWMTNFRKENSAVPRHLRIHWSWNARGHWLASDHPRLEFASAPVLYKLYLIRETSLPDERPKDDPSLEFARRFLPEIKNVLFAEKFQHKGTKSTSWGIGNGG